METPVRTVAARLFAETAAAAIAVGVAVAWAFAVFALLGYGPAEVAPYLSVLCAVALLIAAAPPAEDALHFLTRRGAGRSPWKGAHYGFWTAFAFAGVVIGPALGESVFVISNLADMVLAGLVFGLPPGIAATRARISIIESFFLERILLKGVDESFVSGSHRRSNMLTGECPHEQEERP